MAAKGYSTSKRALCPICDNHHGCKVLDNEMVLCLRGSSQQDAPNGYRFIKPLNNGMGGLFAPGNDDRSWQDDLDYQTRRRQREREQEAKRPRVLSIEDRDRQYQQIITHLALSKAHYQLLLARGFTPQEIEQAGFKSWVPGKRVVGVTTQLAGIDSRGDRLVGRHGIFIPAYDPAGRITGAQIKTDSGKPRKYTWLSSNNQERRPDGNGPHLPNGELPLFVWIPPGADTSEVCLCEGDLKAAIAAFKSGKVYIGASGAQFTSNTLRAYLQELGVKAHGA